MKVVVGKFEVGSNKMSITDVADWISEQSTNDRVWYVKRLAANDTLANKSHQAGVYIPKPFLFSILPEVNRPDQSDPRVRIPAYVDSHLDHREVSAIWYNNKQRGGTRDECRITNWGGQKSAVLDPESTGAIAVFSFTMQTVGSSRSASDVHVWVCNNGLEEDVLEEIIGSVEPGRWLSWIPSSSARHDLFQVPKAVVETCRLSSTQLPPGWLLNFPTGAAIVQKTVELRPLRELNPDQRLIRRRDCEYELFQSIESAVEGTRILQGYRTLEEFLRHALTVLQRRKARAGRSLELQAREIFLEEGLVEGSQFSHSPVIDKNNRPDFLFPSLQLYNRTKGPSAKLRMLAAKTTLRDRWRQILEEASKVRPIKHLLTLQEGISEAQFAQIQAAGVQLVVPEPLHKRYYTSIQPHLMSLDQFITEVRLLAID